MRIAQNKKRSKAKEEAKNTQREALIVEAHQVYIDAVQGYIMKATVTLAVLESKNISNLQDVKTIEEIKRFTKDSERQISQINRRVILGESIPPDEKVFSIFQPHTEWISKGKAGVPVELGLKVCVLEDQYQFILHHIVMEKQTDDQVALSIIREAKKKFPDLHSCSFDKGFHSPENQKSLNDALEFLVLPRKGKLSKQAQEKEQSEEFRKEKKQHSAIESAINALEIHGLDVCPDHGIDGFKRYCALAVVARNIQRIGAILKKQHDIEQIKNRNYLDRRKKAA
jgi:transposase, IS5 family